MFLFLNKQNKKTPQRFEVFRSELNSKLNIKLYNNKAFTLIELLVVIAIIGILSTLVIVSLGNSRAGARDAKRLNDLKAIGNALELYFADNNQYPLSLTPGGSLEANGIVYINKIPENPTPQNDGNCHNSDYVYSSSGSQFTLLGCLGSNTGSVQAGGVVVRSNSGGVQNFPPNIINYTTWTEGTGSAPGFNMNGTAPENIRFIDLDPWGEPTIIWEAQPDSGNDADGGWNSDLFPIDNTKMYRFSVWIHRTVLGNGSFYFGLTGFNSSFGNSGVYRMSDGANSTNPYFINASGSSITNNWTLLVAFAHPAGTPTKSPPYHADSGLYRVANGLTKVGNINYDVIWRPDNFYSRDRSYLFYSTNTATRQRWVYPRVDLVDGTEPSIADLLSGIPYR